MFDTNEYLQLVRDTRVYLQQNLLSPLSCADDCDFFRKKFKESGKKPVLAVVEPPPRPRVEIAIAPQTKPIEVVVQEPAISVSASPIEPPPKPVAVTPPKSPPVVSKPQDSLEWPAFSFSKWKGAVGKIAPDLPIFADPPNDAVAKKIGSRWKTKNLSAPISLLCYQEIPEQKALLEQIALALDVHFGASRLISAEGIEREQQWETFLSVEALRLIIVCDYTLWQMPGLLKYYKETPTRRQIKDKDLFLLPDLSLYIKDPLLKRSLWKALCQICEPLSQASSSTNL